MHAIDGVWMACFALLSLIVAFATGGGSVFAVPQTYLAALTVVFLYVLGFRVRDRSTAVVAAALLSTSPLFVATQIDSVRSSLFVLFTILALAAYATAPYAAAAELMAMIMAAGATIMRPEGLLLGAVLVAFAITDKRPGGIVGLAIYLVLTFTGMGAMLVSTHQHFPMPVMSLNAAPLLSLIDRPTVILSCFVIALLGDLAEPPRRKRLKPVLLWAALFLIFESLCQFTGFSFEAGPFRPILFLLAAGGIARILPAVAGELPTPTLRYCVAVLFVGVLIAARVGAEWLPAKLIVARTMARTAERARSKAAAHATPHTPSHVVTIATAPPPKPSTIVKSMPAHAAPPKPIVVAALPPPSTTIVLTPTKPAAPVNNIGAVPHHYVVVPPGALKPGAAVPGVSAALVAAAAAAGVPTYATHAGKMIPRTAWAIKWDVDHRPKAKPAAHIVATKPAPKPVVAAVRPPAPKPAVVKPVVKPIVHVAAAKPAPKPVVHVAVAKPAPKPVVKPAPIKHAAAPPVRPAAPANSLEAEAAAAGVPTFHIVHGRKVMRNEWAVKWDIAHKPKAAPHKPAPAPVAHKPIVHLAPVAHAAPHPVAPKPHPAVKAAVHRAAPTAHAPRLVRRAAPVHKKWAKPHARRWAPVHKVKRAVHHRSIWAVRWRASHPRR